MVVICSATMTGDKLAEIEVCANATIATFNHVLIGKGYKGTPSMRYCRDNQVFHVQDDTSKKVFTGEDAQRAQEWQIVFSAPGLDGATAPSAATTTKQHITHNINRSQTEIQPWPYRMYRRCGQGGVASRMHRRFTERCCQKMQTDVV